MKGHKAIILLGGGLVCENGLWRTAHFIDEGDRHGMTGDALRVAATAVLGRKLAEHSIIVSGGVGQYKDELGAPTVASVNAFELETAGIMKERIFLEDEGVNTWTQLQKTKKIIIEKKIVAMTFVTNRWHIPRVLVMIERDEFLRSLLAAGALECLSAEDVLIESDVEVWKVIVDTAYQDQRMHARIQKEEEGIQDIKNGTYRF